MCLRLSSIATWKKVKIDTKLEFLTLKIIIYLNSISYNLIVFNWLNNFFSIFFILHALGAASMCFFGLL